MADLTQVQIGNLFGIMYRLEKRMENIELLLCEIYSRDKLKGILTNLSDDNIQMDCEFYASGKSKHEPIKTPARKKQEKEDNQPNLFTLEDDEIPF